MFVLVRVTQHAGTNIVRHGSSIWSRVPNDGSWTSSTLALRQDAGTHCAGLMLMLPLRPPLAFFSRILVAVDEPLCLAASARLPFRPPPDLIKTRQRDARQQVPGGRISFSHFCQICVHLIFSLSLLYPTVPPRHWRLIATRVVEDSVRWASSEFRAVLRGRAHILMETSSPRWSTQTTGRGGGGSLVSRQKHGTHMKAGGVPAASIAALDPAQAMTVERREAKRRNQRAKDAGRSRGWRLVPRRNIGFWVVPGEVRPSAAALLLGAVRRTGETGEGGERGATAVLAAVRRLAAPPGPRPLLRPAARPRAGGRGRFPSRLCLQSRQVLRFPPSVIPFLQHLELAPETFPTFAFFFSGRNERAASDSPQTVRISTAVKIKGQRRQTV